MLIKAGVDISRLERNTRRSLYIVIKIFHEFGEEAVITSTYEGTHGAGTLHYANQAYDVRLPNDNRSLILARIKGELGPDFDVVHEASHYHIEFDPKGG